MKTTIYKTIVVLVAILSNLAYADSQIDCRVIEIEFREVTQKIKDEADHLRRIPVDDKALKEELKPTIENFVKNGQEDRVKFGSDIKNKVSEFLSRQHGDMTCAEPFPSDKGGLVFDCENSEKVVARITVNYRHKVLSFGQPVEVTIGAQTRKTLKYQVANAQVEADLIKSPDIVNVIGPIVWIGDEKANFTGSIFVRHFDIDELPAIQGSLVRQYYQKSHSSKCLAPAPAATVPVSADVPTVDKD